jgi:hypothetical protein
VRVTTAFNRMLGLPGASVIGVEFGTHGVVVRAGCAAGGGCARSAARSAG